MRTRSSRRGEWIAQSRHHPVVLVLSRQAMPTLDRTKYAPATGLHKGAYVVADSDQPEVILIGTGTEVGLCIAAHEKLVAAGVKSRVVSMPSWELFEEQDAAYRDAVLPPAITARVVVEQASNFGWERYVGRTGAMITMRTFGASAPLKELQTKFGFAPDNIVAAAKAQLAKKVRRPQMQLGMIGLGRMGANMARRLMRNGHKIVAYDRSADAVKQLAAEGATGADSLDGDDHGDAEAAPHLDHGAVGRPDRVVRRGSR